MASFHDFVCLSNDYFSFNKTEDIVKNEENSVTNPYRLLETTFILLIFIYFSKERMLCEKNQRSARTRLMLFILVITSIILLPFLLSIVFMFAIYRQAISFILKVKLKSKFGGLLKGTDTVWAIEDVSRSLINILLIVQYDNFEKLHATVRNAINQKFFKNTNRFPKLLSTYHKAFGYYYFRKNQVLLDDCITILQSSEEETIDKDELLKMLSKISNDPLPKNHTAFWQVLVGRQSVKWRNNIETNMTFYPIVFRIHHSLGDGSSLLNILMGIFADTPEKVEPENLKTNIVYSKENRLKLLLNYFNKQVGGFLKKFEIYKKNIYIILSAPSKILLQTLRVPDQNILHGSYNLSGQKVLALKVEDYPHYIEIVKSIKKNVPGVTFSDILFTAISRSFKQYFKMNTQEIPNFLTAVVPVYPEISEYSQVGKINTSLLDNKFLVAMLTLPLKSSDSFGFTRKTRITEILEMVKNETNALRNSNDYQINYLLLSIVSTILPEPLLRPLLNSSQSTLIVSNVPGPPAVSMFGGIPLEDVVFWIPHRGSTGIGISILSYDGRLQMGINIDKNLMHGDTDAQNILDGVFNSLIEMDYEIRSIGEQV